MKQNPEIIVTGAAGFIGSALIWRLNQKGITRILAVDHLKEDDRWRNLVPLRYSDYWDREEFAQRLQTKILPDSIHTVYHLGACSATTERDSGFLMRNNFAFTRDLSVYCLDRSSPIRFVYASSAATYGDGSLGYQDDHALIPELRPLNAYGYSKQAFDAWALHQGILQEMAGLKYFNVYGPNEYHKGEMRSMVIKAFEQIQSHGRVQLFKSHRPEYRDGEQVRDFLHVLDAVDITLFLGENRQAGGIFNVGTGEARTWKDMMLALFMSLGRDPQIDFVDMPEILRGKYQYYTKADISKLQAAGYLPTLRSLEQGIADTVPYLIRGNRVLGD